MINGCAWGSSSGSSGDGVAEGGGKRLLIEPVGGGWRANGTIRGCGPEFGAVGAPEGIERPAFGGRRPGGLLGGDGLELPGAIAGEDEHGIDPDAPLDGEDGAVG